VNYEKHYDALIERARARELDGYSETHHIIPRCMGGEDCKSNLVRLTAGEHFVAHQFLVKMHPQNHSLLWALSAMTHATVKMSRPNNKRYGWLREKFANTMRERFAGVPLSAEHKEKLSQKAKERVRGHLSEETRFRISSALSGKKKSKAHCDAMRISKLGKPGPKRTPEWLANQAEGIRRATKSRDMSFLQTTEYRAKVSSRMKEIWAERKANKEG